jgi:hypothetical protein
MRCKPRKAKLEMMRQLVRSRISKKDQERYLQKAFIGCIESGNYSTISKDLGEILGLEILPPPEQIINQIDTALERLDRYSEKNYPHPHFGHFHEP